MAYRRVEAATEDLRAARLAKRAEISAATGVSVRTATKYLLDLRIYDGFLAEHGCEDDGDPRLADAYTLACAKRGLLRTSIAKRLTSIRWRHRAAGDVTYTARRILRHLMGGGYVPSNQAVVLSLSAFHALVAAASTPGRAGPFGEFLVTRNQALISVGFAGKLRPYELTLACIEDLVRHSDGYWLNLPISKTNQRHERQEGVWLGPRGDQLDPVAGLDRLLARFGELGVSGGPLFRSRNFWDDPHGLAPHRINVVLKKIAEQAGVTPRVSGYSLRRSSATLDYLAGVPIETISILLRHDLVDTTALYLAEIPNPSKATYLDPDAPPAWTGGYRAAAEAARPGWSAAGSLENLLADAREIVVDDAFGLKPETRANRLGLVKVWGAFAATEEIDPEQPRPEEIGWFLICERERGVSLATLQLYFTALEWWFSTAASPATEAIAFAETVLRRLQNTPPDDTIQYVDPLRAAQPGKCAVEPEPVTALLRFIDTPPPPGYWILAAAVLLRTTGLERSAFRGLDASCAALGDGGASLQVGDVSLSLAHEHGDHLQCPACALELLVQHAGRGQLLDHTSRRVLRVSMLWFSKREEPTHLSDDEWAAIVDRLATPLRLDRRNRAGIALSYAGLLGRGDLLGLRWEDLREDGPGLAAEVGRRLRKFEPRDDSLDPIRALRELADVWPWRGQGLWGCRGPVMALMSADRLRQDPETLVGTDWADAVRQRGRKSGLTLSPSTLRVSGSLHDWHEHRDLLRLNRRRGDAALWVTEDFLDSYGVLHRPPTEPRDGR